MSATCLVILGTSTGLVAGDCTLSVSVPAGPVDTSGWTLAEHTGGGGLYWLTVPNVVTPAGGTIYETGNQAATECPFTIGDELATHAALLVDGAHGGAAATITTTNGEIGSMVAPLVTYSQQFFRAASAGSLCSPQGWDWAAASSPTAAYSETIPDGGYILAHYIVPGSGANPEIFKIEYDAGGNLLTNIIGGEVYNANGTFLQLEICPGSGAPFPAGTLTVTVENTVLGEQPQTITINVPQVIYCDNYYVTKEGTVVPAGGHNVVPATSGGSGGGGVY